jgi:hypothetical protein
MPGHQTRFDRLQLGIQSLELARQQAEHLARQCRHSFPGRQTPQQLGHLMGSLGDRDAKLRRMAAQGIDQHRALLDQQIAHPEHPRVKPEDQRRLLLGGFDRHKPHGRRLIASQIASAHGSGLRPARGQALIASFLPRLT